SLVSRSFLRRVEALDFVRRFLAEHEVKVYLGEEVVAVGDDPDKPEFMLLYSREKLLFDKVYYLRPEFSTNFLQKHFFSFLNEPGAINVRFGRVINNCFSF